MLGLRENGHLILKNMARMAQICPWETMDLYVSVPISREMTKIGVTQDKDRLFQGKTPELVLIPRTHAF